MKFLLGLVLVTALLSSLGLVRSPGASSPRPRVHPVRVEPKPTNRTRVAPGAGQTTKKARAAGWRLRVPAMHAPSAGR